MNGENHKSENFAVVVCEWSLEQRVLDSIAQGSLLEELEEVLLLPVQLLIPGILGRDSVALPRLVVVFAKHGAEGEMPECISISVEQIGASFEQILWLFCLIVG